MTETSSQNSQVKGKGKVVAEERSPSKVANEYQLKAIEWTDASDKTRHLKIITQNENGPCPLLALCNVLLLRGIIEIKPYDRTSVTYDYLVELLGDYLLKTIPNGEAEIQKGLEELKIKSSPKIQEQQPVNENEESLKVNKLSNCDDKEIVMEFEMVDKEKELDDEKKEKEVEVEISDKGKENEKEVELEISDKGKGKEKEVELETIDERKENKKEVEVEISDERKENEKEVEMEISDKGKEEEKEVEVETSDERKENEQEVEVKTSNVREENEKEIETCEKEKEVKSEKLNTIYQNPKESLSQVTESSENLTFTRPSLQDYHHTLNTALSIIPSLQTGLDVNVKFNSIHGFEPTAELSVFDVFNVELIHGWIVDPQDVETWEVVVGKCGSYNKAVECIVRGDTLSKGVVLESFTFVKKVSDEESEKDRDAMENSKVRDALIVSQFLESTATQLTYHGLLTLSETLPPGNLCVFFRNNHFSTLYKHPKTSVLYILVTDAGFIQEHSMVWESLTDVDQSASEFVNGKFLKGEAASGEYVEVTENNITGGGDQDYALALSLQQQEDDREAEYIRKQQSRRDQEERQQKNNLYPNQIQSDATSQSSINSSFTATSEKDRKKDKKRGSCIIT